MTDLRMGFKHTILQRFEVCPISKTSPVSGVQPQAQVTDFSINRILSENKDKSKKLATIRKFQTLQNTIAPSATSKNVLLSIPQERSTTATDILDLSKSCADSNTSHTSLPFHNIQSYHGLHQDFLTAAAAANATKFYVQLFPHMFPTPHLNVSSTSPYQQKRFFAPYIVNSSNNFQATAHLAPPSNFSASHFPDIIHPNASCHRSEHSNGLDYCKPFPYMITPSLTSLSSLCPTGSMSGNSSKRRSSSELQLNASSTISVSTVTSLTAKATRSSMCVNSTTASNYEEISYKCRICDKVFGCSQTLQAHEKTHKSPRYECTDCGKGFSQLRNFKYHLSVHRGTKEFAAECPECGKTFNDKGYLSSHMKIHRNKKEYECPYCPKSFNQRVAFNMHVRIHTGVKPHKCAECGKRFSRKMLLKQHLRTHSGEKPYQCSVCGKSFADRSNMTLHHRLHSGIKPFNCPICPKAFTKKHHLKTHLNYHTGCKPYVCPHPNCNQAFTQSSNMRTHSKKCQYRPIQFPSYPTVVSTSVAATTSNCSSSSHIPFKTKIPISSSTLAAGIRMLSSGVSTMQTQSFLTQPLPTLRSSF